jgi:ribosomal protein S27AE
MKTEYIEYNFVQPHEFTCPKCEGRFYSDVPQITIICGKCGAALIRKDFAKCNDVFAKPVTRSG